MDIGEIDSIGKQEARERQERVQAGTKRVAWALFWVVYIVLVYIGGYYSGLACLQGYCG